MKLISCLLVTCFVSSCMTLLPNSPAPINKYEFADVSNTVVAPEGVGRNGDAFGRVVSAGDLILFMTREKVFQLVKKDENHTYYKEVISWKASPDTRNSCTQRGIPDYLCFNFITVVLNIAKSNFTVCGTNACSPKCRNYTLRAGKFKLEKEFPGTNLSPCKPTYTIASYYQDGSIYSGTVSDVRGTKPIIHRYSFDVNKPLLSTTKSNELWLNVPTFVDFRSDGGKKVFSFFKELAVEERGSLMYSRVAQTCVADKGGTSLLKNQFTSYQKARLLCTVPGDTTQSIPPFYFNELQAVSEFVTFEGRDRVIFGIMTTPSNSITGSAICAYHLDEINHVFVGNVLTKETTDTNYNYWAEVPVEENLKSYIDSCQALDEENHPRELLPVELNFMRDHPMKADGVRSWRGMKSNENPVFLKTDAKYNLTAITVDENIEQSDKFIVIFVGTSDGHILKLAALRKNGEFIKSTNDDVVLIEERLVYDADKCGNNRIVQSIIMDVAEKSLTVNFDDCSVITPLCPIVTSCHKECLSAFDPYCAWDGSSCTTTLKQDVRKAQDVEALPDCPVIEPVVPITEPKDDNKLGNDSAVLSPSTTVLVPILSDVEMQVKSAGSLPMIIPILIGIVIGIALSLSVFFVYRCKKTKKFEKSLSEPKMNGSVHHDKSNDKSRHNSESSRRRTTSEKSVNSRSENAETDGLLTKNENSENLKRSYSSDSKKNPRHNSTSSHKKRTSKPSVSSFDEPPPDFKRSVSNESQTSRDLEARNNAENDRLNKSLPTSGFKSDEAPQTSQKPRKPVTKHLSLNMPNTPQKQYFVHPDTPMPQYGNMAPLMHPPHPVHSNSYPGMMNTQSLDRRKERARKNTPQLADVSEDAEPPNQHSNPRKRYQSESASAPIAIRPPLGRYPKHMSIDEEEPPPSGSPPKRTNLRLDLNPTYNHRGGAVTGPAMGPPPSATPMRNPNRRNSPSTPGEYPYGAYPMYPHGNTMRPLRQHSEMMPGGHQFNGYGRHPQSYQTMHHHNKQPMLKQQSMFEQRPYRPVGVPIQQPQSHSNPNSPEDPNVNILQKQSSEERARHPSGKSQHSQNGHTTPGTQAPPPLMKQESYERSRHISGPPATNGGNNVTRKSPGESPSKAFSIPANNGAGIKSTEEIHSTL